MYVITLLGILYLIICNCLYIFLALVEIIGPEPFNTFVGLSIYILSLIIPISSLFFMVFILFKNHWKLKRVRHSKYAPLVIPSFLHLGYIVFVVWKTLRYFTMKRVDEDFRKRDFGDETEFWEDIEQRFRENHKRIHNAFSVSYSLFLLLVNVAVILLNQGKPGNE